MALKLTKTFPQGYQGGYWKLIQTNVDWLNRTSHVDLALYLDKATRDSKPGQGVMFCQGFDWSGDDFPFVDGVDLRGSAYKKIKNPILDKDGNNTNPFTEAIDI
jgi:hypothetical protein